MECEGENKKTKAQASDSKTYGSLLFVWDTVVLARCQDAVIATADRESPQ